MKKISIKKLAIITVALVAAYTLVGFFGVPLLVKWLAQKKLTELLHRQVTIEDIDLNPFALTSTVTGFAVKNREGEGDLVAFDSLYANLQGSSLFKLGLVVSELRLTNPRLDVVRLAQGSYNFSDLIPPPKAPPPTEEKPGSELHFSVNNIQIINGRIDFRDDLMGKKHSVQGLTLALPFISNFVSQVDIFVEPLLTAEVNGKPVAFRGKAKPFASRLETVFDIDLTDVDVPYYLAYVPTELKFKVPSALLDAKAHLSFVTAAETGPSLVLSGEAALKTVAITDPGGEPLLNWERLQVTIAPSELLAGDIHLSRIGLERPEITLKRTGEGAFNFQQVMPAAASPESAAPSNPPAEQPILQVDEIVLDQGRVFFSDLSENPPFETTLFPIDIKISDFSNQKNRSAAVDLAVKSEAGETVTLTGKFSIDPLASTGTISLAQAVLAKYAPYYGDYIKFSVESGTLDFQTGFEVDQGEKTPKIALADLSTRLQNLKLKQLGEEKGFLDIPELSVARTSVDVDGRSVVVGEILSQNGWVAVKRLEIGDLDVQHLFEPPSTSASAAGPGNGEEPAWQITLNHLLIDQYTLEGEDHTFAEPTRMVLDQAKLEVENFSTAGQNQTAVLFSGRYNKKGSLFAKGSIGIDPPAGELELKIAGHEPVWFQKYFEDQVQVIATGGKIDADGTLSFAMSEEKGLTLSYRGDLKVADFKSVERANSDEFVSFKQLAIEGAAVSINPTSLSVDKISLDNFFTRLVLTQEGRLNIQDTVKTGGKEKVATETAGDEAPVPVKIATVVLKSGRVKFFDRFVAPGYSTTLGGIEGTLTGLSTDRTQTADIKLKARLDEQAPLQISGKINPLAEELYADVAIKFDQMDLSSLSPYSGKYAGYKIQKGKLFLDLNYRIENKNLQAKNYVHLDQLEFGKRVESPEATDLPVTLAVALLKDRSGKITLDLPVSGRLDDPEFSVAGIILKMIGNLLAKAATAPFALVEAMLGGGKELSQIEFAYGTSQLDEAGAAKLDQLATVLYDRPGLKLDISGYVDQEKDSEGLVATLFENKLKAQKLKALTGQGQAAGSLEEVTLLPEEYEVYLAAAFSAAGIPAPEGSTEKGGEKKPSGEKDEASLENRIAEMERLLKGSIRVGESDLQTLARDRAQAVKGYLLQSEKVEPERIFLIDPDALDPPQGEGQKKSRVMMALK